MTHVWYRFVISARHVDDKCPVPNVWQPLRRYTVDKPAFKSFCLKMNEDPSVLAPDRERLFEQYALLYSARAWWVHLHRTWIPRGWAKHWVDAFLPFSGPVWPGCTVSSSSSSCVAFEEWSSYWCAAELMHRVSPMIESWIGTYPCLLQSFGVGGKKEKLGPILLLRVFSHVKTHYCC